MPPAPLGWYLVRNLLKVNIAKVKHIPAVFMHPFDRHAKRLFLSGNQILAEKCPDNIFGEILLIKGFKMQCQGVLCMNIVKLVFI